jgi:hypothetical protein
MRPVSFSSLHHAPLEDPPESFARGEQALWAAVITQALMDAASASAKDDARYARRIALRWLALPDDDFTTVCDMAGLDPDYVHTNARRAVARECQWRRPAGRGWRAQERIATLSLIRETEAV